MAYSTNETSVQSGAPVELYEFRSGSDFYRYTSADANVVYQSKTYEAVVISRGDIEATVEVARNPLKINCSINVGVLNLFLYSPPGEVVTLSIFRMHRGDSEAVTIWMGRVLNVTWAGSQASIHCESVYSSIKRPGLRRMYQKACPHVLYSGPCGVNSSAFRVNASVLSVSTTTVNVSGIGAYAADYFAGGYLEWEYETGKFERRAIQSNTTSAVVISSRIQLLAGGVTVRLYPGCNHTLSVCNSKFSNVVNFGGFPWIPQKNPFGGIDGPIF